ncbi:MAG: hypothetical protein AB3N13_13650 [Arenibacterium sp.]
MRYFLVGLAFIANGAFAQDWALRDGDVVFDQQALSALSEGAALTFFDDGTSRFSAGGSYSYTYASGESAFGRFEIGENGQICIQFRNGFGRCDTYVRNAGRIVLLTEKGERYPVRDFTTP